MHEHVCVRITHMEDPHRLSPLRLSFGMIVFNGAAFLKETIDAVYADAHEIIIVEGADKNAWSLALPDGSSTDETIAIIKNYPDLKKKIRLIQGKWQDKTHASNEYLRYVTGDYVWHLDDDEVYRKEDIAKIRARLSADTTISAVSFHFKNFFRGFAYETVAYDGSASREVWRIFKYVPGAQYTTHRPPTLVHPDKTITNDSSPLRAKELVDEGIFFYHFSYITDAQVEQKMRYHTNLRLREQDCGIPFLEPLKKIPSLQRFWRWLWHHRSMDSLRIHLDSRYFNYQYVQTVWQPWDHNREKIELLYNVLPAMPRSKTVQYHGPLPETVRARNHTNNLL